MTRITYQPAPDRPRPPFTRPRPQTRQRLEARATVEEDLFARVPLSKDEAKRLKKQRREGMSGAGACGVVAVCLRVRVCVWEAGGGEGA